MAICSSLLLLFVLYVGRGRTGGLGGGAGGGGLGGGIGKDRKHLQIYIPLFLAMNAIGWMGLAMKAVSILTFKALIVSKLAFVIILSIIVKKFMDNATERYNVIVVAR